FCRPRNSTTLPRWRGRWVSRKSPADHSCAPATMPTRWFMHKAVVVPDLGKTDPVLSLWLAGPGEHVYAGDRIVELLVEEATFDVAAATTGKLVDQSARPGHALRPGRTVGL